jgi:hypothetical protein
MSHTVGFPLFDPIDERPEFLAGCNAILCIQIPCSLQIVVVDEEFDVFWTIFASQTAGLTHIFEVAHIVLPIEGIATYVPCSVRVIAL